MLNIKQGYKRTASIAYTKHDGTAGEVEGKTVWTSSDEAIIAVKPSEDGLSADLIAVGLGEATISASADGDLGEGVFPIVIQEVFVGVPALGAESAGLKVSDEIAA